MQMIMLDCGLLLAAPPSKSLSWPKQKEPIHRLHSATFVKPESSHVLFISAPPGRIKDTEQMCVWLTAELEELHNQGRDGEQKEGFEAAAVPESGPDMCVGADKLSAVCMCVHICVHMGT